MSRQFVFLHGSPSDRGVWTALLDGAPAAAHVHALDLPDHGDAPDAATENPTAFEDLVAASLRSVVGTEPIVLVGHSFGAFVAARLAGKGGCGLTIERMVLISGLSHLPVAQAEAFVEMAQAVESGALPIDVLVEQMIPAWLGEARSAVAEQYVRDTFLACSRERLVRGVRRLARVGFDDVQVGDFAMPTEVVHGERDAAVAPALGRDLARRGEQATWHVLDTASHMLPLTHADALRRIVFPP